MNNFLLFGSLGAPEIIIIAFLVLLLFGGKKIPELMKGIGKGVKSFKDGMKGIEDDVKETNDTPESKDKTIENIAIIFSSVVFSSCVRAERTPSVFLPFLNFLFIHFLHCLFYYAILMARLQHWIEFCIYFYRNKS